MRAFFFALVYCAHVYASTSSTTGSADALLVVTRSASAALWVMGAHVSWLPAAVAQCVVVVLARLSLDADVQYKAIAESASAEVAGANDDDIESASQAGTEHEFDLEPRGHEDLRPALRSEPHLPPHPQPQPHLQPHPREFEFSPLPDETVAMLAAAQQSHQPQQVQVQQQQLHYAAEPPSPLEEPQGRHVCESSFGPLSFRQISGNVSDAPVAPPSNGTMTQERMAAIAAKYVQGDP